MTEMKPQSASNPHGIDHILARPSSVQSPRALPPAISAAAAAASYYKHHTHPLADLTSRSPLYWPGLQGLVGNPIAWRDRLANSEYKISLLKFNKLTLILKYHYLINNNFYILFITSFITFTSM
ncbi:hypothetical protein O3M35_006759 [Rhynocoris fuscipes]|uniref:Uncharacterized protein n=1 Tax=Rhynocoris fuscipes TaxID=488301 RepID=A0AAW1DEW3_9HEMI